MTLHPLTRELLSARFEYSPHRDEAIDKIVRGYLTSRAAWLKGQGIKPIYIKGQLTDESIFVSLKQIDQAFQLDPETLEEKFKAIQREHDGKSLSPTSSRDDLLNRFAKAAEEHFNNQSSARTVNCSAPQSGGTC